MSEYYTSKKCWQCGDWLVRTRGPNVRYYHCEQCKGDRNGKSRHPFEENKDVIAALSLLRIGTMLLTDGSRPVEWCSDALRLHAGTPAASAPTGRKRPSQEKKTTKAKKKTKKTNEEDEEDDDATYDESDEEEELVLDETSDDDDNDDDVDDDVDDKPKVGESRAFCVCLLTTHTTRRAVATYSALALQLGKT